MASPDHRLTRRNSFFLKRWDPGPFGWMGEEIPTPPASPASSPNRCSGHRRRPQRAAQRGSRPPAPTPPPGAPPGPRRRAAAAALRSPSAAPSLPPTPNRRPARGPLPAGPGGRPGPPGTFDDAFGGGEAGVPLGHGPLSLRPAPGAPRRAPPPASRGLGSRGRSARRAAPQPWFLGAAQAPEGSGRSASQPRTPPTGRRPTGRSFQRSWPSRERRRPRFSRAARPARAHARSRGRSPTSRRPARAAAPPPPRRARCVAARWALPPPRAPLRPGGSRPAHGRFLPLRLPAAVSLLLSPRPRLTPPLPAAPHACPRSCSEARPRRGHLVTRPERTRSRECPSPWGRLAESPGPAAPRGRGGPLPPVRCPLRQDSSWACPLPPSPSRRSPGLTLHVGGRLLQRGGRRGHPSSRGERGGLPCGADAAFPGPAAASSASESRGPGKGLTCSPALRHLPML